MLDVGTRISAPFCAGLLGEMGAEVIKIEQPGTGDFMRGIGPFLDTDDGSYSLFWAVEGRGRKSVTLDLRKRAGAQIFRDLAATSDVVCENFRPGTLERWGLAPADLDPTLVTVRISAFGQDGPNALSGPASTDSASATAACCTSPVMRIGRPSGPASPSATT